MTTCINDCWLHGLQQQQQQQYEQKHGKARKENSKVMLIIDSNANGYPPHMQMWARQWAAARTYAHIYIYHIQLICIYMCLYQFVQQSN